MRRLRVHCPFLISAMVHFIANTVHATEQPEKSKPVAKLPAVTPRVAPRVSTPQSPLTGAGAAAPPVPKRTWQLPAVIALGIGGLGAGGAVVTEIVGSGRHDDPKLDCGTHCGTSHDEHSLALATKVLAGIGAAGVGAGLVLLLTSPKKEESPTLTPSIKFNFSGSKVTAKAVWRF